MSAGTNTPFRSRSCTELCVVNLRRRKTEVMRNPGLLDEMEYLHLVSVFSEKSRRCIHCNSHDTSPESRFFVHSLSREAICSLCKATFFFNPKLENAYKYCDVCHDFHYFMFFLSDDGQSFHPECVVSSIPVRPSFRRFISFHPNMQMSLCPVFLSPNGRCNARKM